MLVSYLLLTLAVQVPVVLWAGWPHALWLMPLSASATILGLAVVRWALYLGPSPPPLPPPRRRPSSVR